MGAGVGDVDFTRDVRPILSDKCFTCHGPERKTRRGRLRLDTRKGAFEGGRGEHKVVVPGQPEESELWLRLTSDDPEERMPPAEVKKRPTKEEIETLGRWIAQGAPWQDHWAFIAPKRPPLPKVKRAGWARGEIDRFVLARLEREGIEPSPEADRATSIRRVSLDLTGLPPSPDSVDAFVADSDPRAWERLVDRLLASPRYGEHMARYWLDAARYGDTHGLHLDNRRVMWPYRDWVIRAFNRNLPYDRFGTEQLAGDLLPGATLDQRVASGFNRCHVTTNEGGTIEEEYYVRNVVDRVSTTATVFMGLTAGCAVCHDHKYDPLKQKDFYQLFAFFNSLDGRAMDGNAAAPPPSARVPTLEERERIAELRGEIASLEREIRDRVTAFDYHEPAEEPAEAPPAPVEVVWIEDDLPAGARAQGGWRFVDEPVFSGKKASTRTAEGLGQHSFEGAREPLVIAEGDVLFAHVRIDPDRRPREIMLQFNDGSWEHRAYWGENAIDWGADATASRRSLGDLPAAGEWVRLEVPAAVVGLAPGAKLQGWAFTQFDGRVWWDRAGVVTRADPSPAFRSLGAWSRWASGSAGASLPAPLRDALARPEADRSESEIRRLRDWFVENVFPGSRELFAPMHRRRVELEKEIESVEKSFPTTLVFKELAKPRKAYLLRRGQYDQKGALVERETPAFLPPFPEGAPRNRLGLARWLFDPAHPLTARVEVNRIWQQIFGVGIVKTAEDFGSQGDPPSHPELLDWLASEFVRSGWDVKRLVRAIVTSSTYRQSSSAPRELRERDPENRLLARGPRFRLDGEVLRDQALQAAGLLSGRIGGPSVKPPQPAGLWYAVGYTSSNTAHFKADSGEKIWRRGLYTFWKRTAPPPQLTTFDAPSRETCIVRRERTNTPLQALVLLNETQFVEAARRLAERARREAGAEPEARARRMFRLLAARAPSAEDLADLLGFWREQVGDFRARPEAAHRLLSASGGEAKGEEPSELAAWTLVGSLILNLDEVVSKG